MIYSREDFLMLEKMTDEELAGSIEQAKKDYDGVQDYFSKMEQEALMDCPFPSCLPNLDILFSQLKNIEGYI